MIGEGEDHSKVGDILLCTTRRRCTIDPQGGRFQGAETCCVTLKRRRKYTRVSAYGDDHEETIDVRELAG